MDLWFCQHLDARKREQSGPPGLGGRTGLLGLVREAEHEDWPPPTRRDARFTMTHCPSEARMSGLRIHFFGLILIAFGVNIFAGCDNPPPSQQPSTPHHIDRPPTATADTSSGFPLPPRNSKFARVDLPMDVSIEVPRNWRLLDGEINTTIETAGEAAMNLAGVELPAGQKINLFRANSNPPGTYAGIAINATDSEIPPSDVMAASDSEIREFGSLMHQMLDRSLASLNQRVIRFVGIRREIVDGHPALVMEYVRSGADGPVAVQMTRLFIGKKEISLNLSYRQREAGLWRPVVDYMRSTFRVSQP